MESSRTEPHPMALLQIAGTTILGGALIGATTNAINGAVSPAYFRSVMRWENVEHIWRASIAQGIFEGLIYGVVFALVFTLVVGRVSRARCPYSLALRHLLKIFAAVYGSWIVGGVLSIGLALLSPEFYRETFIGVPDTWADLVRYAWVGGSIWGAVLGGLLAVVIGSILFSVHWHRSDSPTVEPFRTRDPSAEAASRTPSVRKPDTHPRPCRPRPYPINQKNSNT